MISLTPVIAVSPLRQRLIDEMDHVTTAQLAIDIKSESARSRSLTCWSSQKRIAQTYCGLSALFAPNGIDDGIAPRGMDHSPTPREIERGA